MNPTASLRPFRRDTLYIGIEVCRLWYGIWISAWNKVLKDCGIHFFLSFHRIHFNAPACLAFVASCQQRGSDVTLFPSGGPWPRALHRLPHCWYAVITVYGERESLCAVWGEVARWHCVKPSSPVGYHLASRLCSTVARISEHKVTGIT